MNFGATNNNTKEQKNTNTRGPQFMNKDGFFPSTLVLGYWNGFVSIKFHPALEPSKQTENKVFDYDKDLTTSLTLEKVTTLINQIETQVIPAMTAGEDKSIGVPVRGDVLFQVGTKQTENGPVAFAGLFTDISPETKKPGAYIFYEFRKGVVVEDYDPEVGNMTINNTLNSELELFVSSLKAAQSALSNAYVHATRTVDRYFRDSIQEHMDAIGDKVGAASPRQNRGGGYSRSKSNVNVFGSEGGSQGRSGGSRSDGASFDAPVQEIKTTNDLAQFMN